MRTLAKAGLLGFMLVATAVPVTAAHAETAAAARPYCPEKAPEGGEYVRTVWAYPPYDVYRVPQPDGSYKTVNVSCL